MNLSSYLQMPPAPNVPTSTSSLTPQGVRTGAGPSAGGNMGFDFAQVMARQIQRLAPQERQSLAAEALQNPEPAAREQEISRSEAPRHQNQTDRSDQEARKARTTDRDTQEDDNEDTQATSRTRPRARPSAQKTNTTDITSLLEGMPAVAVTASHQPAETASSDNTTTSVAAAVTPLQTIELSPQVRIITDPKTAPSPESLAAFAKSMGLDESTIQNLLGQQPAIASGVTPTTGEVAATGVPSPALTQLQASMGALTQPAHAAAHLSPMHSEGAANLQQLTAMTTAVATPEPVISGAGLALSASTLQAPAAPGLTPTDMAAIQQIQITVLPAAVLPVNAAHSNTPMPSTLDMLSLLGSGVDEQDVSALLTRFSAETGSDGQPSEHHESHSESGNSFGSFSQALARNNNTANAATPTAAATAPSMTEVYDQLSDKMATELAARMHKQLSDGEWKMKFGLRPANLGGVEIHLEMKDGKLDAVFHADNPLTRDLLQNSSQRLREALGNFGINAGQVQVGQGGGNSQQNASGNSGRQPQVRDNSTSQVNGSDSATSAPSARSKAHASLLDLYA
ncbi:MAG: flagellar hook-length control protein FliK [Limnohabitans sp.]